MNPAIWVPAVALEYVLGAYLTYRSSVSGGQWFYAMWFISFLPMWPLISLYSRDVVFDGMVFDITMTVAYTAAIMIFTSSFSRFGASQYLGIALLLAGLYFFKKGT